MTSNYIPRLVDSLLVEIVTDGGAVLLEGPRACGKSATGSHHAASAVQLDIDVQAARLAKFDPVRLLDGPQPRFIDEWQLTPGVWNQVRAAVDNDPDAAFILAGSAVPADDATRHSGAGRIVRLRMRPMSLAESGDSSRQVSLRDLFDPAPYTAHGVSPLTVDDLAALTVRGGWPGLIRRPPARAARILTSYLDDVARIDVPRLDAEPARHPDGLLRLIRSLGRVTGTEASLSAIARDVSAVAPTTHETIGAYLAALGRVFVVEDQPSWGPHLRSRDQIRKAPKRHFTDPSLAAAAVGAGPDRLLADLEYFGQLFESLVVRDLRAYSQPLDAEVRHYRDSAGREVDAVVERRDGQWIAAEVKLAASRDDEAASALLAFVDKLDPTRTPPPAALVVITGGRYAYTRPDGVHVVPLGCLTA